MNLIEIVGDVIKILLSFFVGVVTAKYIEKKNRYTYLRALYSEIQKNIESVKDGTRALELLPDSVYLKDTTKIEFLEEDLRLNIVSFYSKLDLYKKRFSTDLPREYERREKAEQRGIMLGPNFVEGALEILEIEIVSLGNAIISSMKSKYEKKLVRG